MLIGAISDTHNNLNCVKQAVKLFNSRKVNLVLHCGDFSLPSIAKEFENLNCPFKAVFGNNDFDCVNFENIISNFGIIQEAPFEFTIDEKFFVITHHLSFIKDTNKYDCVLFGHTHKSITYKQGKTIFTNPGEACGQRYGRKTVAIINTNNFNVEFFDLDLES